MKTIKTQGNGHKVAGTQEIYERVAEICSKYGIEFEDKMLRRHPGNKWNGNYWSFTPYEVMLTAPRQTAEYKPRALVGMMVYDDDPNYWYPINADVDDFNEKEKAAFSEIATILV